MMWKKTSAQRWGFAALPLLMGLLSGSAAAGETVVVESVSSVAAARIEVDLSARKLHVYSGATRINTFPVAIGTAEHPTPVGQFRITRIVWNPDWVPPDEPWARDETRKAPGDPNNPMQGAKIFFKYPDYYIHGTNAPGSLGSAASHGCLRMNKVDVENLAIFIQKAGGADRGDAWFDRIRRSKTEKTEIILPRSVQITIRK